MLFPNNIELNKEEIRMPIIMINPYWKVSAAGITEKTCQDLGEDFTKTLNDLCPVGYNPAQFMKKVIGYINISKHDTGNYIEEL
jgi:hypothetical protein